MTGFPTTVDTFPSAATLASHNLSTDPHSTLHGNLGDGLTAAMTKIGVDGSTVTTSLDYIKTCLEMGWRVSSDAWVRDSNTQYHISSAIDRTSRYQKGTRLLWTESGTVKYATVASSSFAASTTTIVLFPTSDFVMAASPDANNGTPVLPGTVVGRGAFYSHESSPAGYPTFFNRTAPTCTGFSVQPTSSSYRYRVDGNMVTEIVRQGGNGTSNGLSLGIPSVVTCDSAGSATNDAYYAWSSGVDLGATLTTICRAQIAPTDTSILCVPKPDGASTGWNNTLGKRMIGFTLPYKY